MVQSLNLLFDLAFIDIMKLNPVNLNVKKLENNSTTQIPIEQRKIQLKKIPKGPDTATKSEFYMSEIYFSIYSLFMHCSKNYFLTR